MFKTSRGVSSTDQQPTRDMDAETKALKSIGVCILNWNTKRNLLDCVLGLIERVGIGPGQIVVVDNCSRDGSTSALRGLFPSVVVRENKTNLGYSRGNNVGAAYLIARGFPYLLFLNPDVVLEGSTLREMIRVMEAGPRVGCVGAVPTRNGAPVRTAVRNRPSAVEKIVLYPDFRFKHLGATL